MIAKSEMRKIECLTADGCWVECTMGQLEIGDTFRMFEPDGDPVRHWENNEDTIFKAKSVACIEIE